MTAIGRSVPIDGEGRPRQDQPRSRVSGVPGLRRIASGWRSLSLVLLLSLLVRIPFIPLFAYLPDGSLDESDWKGWMQALHEHGFLNIFGATALVHARALSRNDLPLILGDEDPAHFRFDMRGFKWNDAHATVEEICDARRNLIVSFGSCSFEEPLEDLQKLGML